MNDPLTSSKYFLLNKTRIAERKPGRTRISTACLPLRAITAAGPAVESVRSCRRHPTSSSPGSVCSPCSSPSSRCLRASPIIGFQPQSLTCCQHYNRFCLGLLRFSFFPADLNKSHAKKTQQTLHLEVWERASLWRR